MIERWAEEANWADVLACFADRKEPLAVIQRLGNEWAEHYNLTRPIPTFGSHMVVVREHWPGHEIGEHLDKLAIIVPALITCQKPRRLSGAMVIVDFASERIGQIDGRCRANVWRGMRGLFEVLRICAY